MKFINVIASFTFSFAFFLYPHISHGSPALESQIKTVSFNPSTANSQQHTDIDDHPFEPSNNVRCMLKPGECMADQLEKDKAIMTLQASIASGETGLYSPEDTISVLGIPPQILG